MPPLASSLRVRGFAPLAGSYTVNELGDNFGVVALALLVLDHTGSALGTAALFLAAKFLPAFVSPFTTAALDRRPAGRVLPVLYLVEAAAFAALALLADDAFWLPAVLLLAFFDGLLALTARGLSRGAVAATLGPAGLLREGNAVLNVAFAVTSAGAPAVAGLVVGAGGAALALWIDAASFGVVAVGLLLFGRAIPAPKREDREPWFRRVGDGIRYVRRHPVAGRLVVGEGVALVFFTLVVPIEVVYAKETLDAGDFGFGLLLTSWGLGIVVGSAIFARAGSRSLGTMVLLSTAIIGAAYGGMAIAPTLAVACVASVLGGVGNGVQWVAVMTALQEAVGDDYQARAAGLLESVMAAVPGLGFLVGGVLAAAVSPRAAYLVAGAGVVAVVLAWSRRPLVRETAAA